MRLLKRYGYIQIFAGADEKIKREEEMYKLQKTHTATLTSLENSYDTVEVNKKYLLATIEKTE